MKVIYNSSDGRTTFHPELGQLDPGKPFDLPADTAGKYIKAGLLSKYEKTKKSTEEVKGNGNSTNG